MAPHRLLPAALVLLLAGGWASGQILAAEPGGPRTTAAPASCSESAGLFSVAALLTPAGEAASAVTTLCGCGAASCIGKVVGESCAGGLICAVDGICATTPAARKCACILPP